MWLKKLILLALVIRFAFPATILATEFEISGNGDSSSSEVQVTQNNASNVVQNNNASITNDININANTGNNSVDQSTGNSTIDTGNVNANVSVLNQANTSLNQSSQNNSNLNATISGNGSNSQNNISYSQTNNGTNTTNNVANIITTINGLANTGYNSANANVGNVNIKTGNILLRQLIENGQINSSITTVKQSKNNDVATLVKGNGSDSINNIDLDQNLQKQSFVNNNAVINNQINLQLNTGWNTANRNSGGVSISTGNILADLIIRNTDINSNIVKLICNPDKPKEVEKPNLAKNPSNAAASSSNSGSSAGGSTSGVGGPQIIGLSVTSAK